MKSRVTLTAALLAIGSTSSAFAKDYGQVGTVFPVMEVDLLRVIETRLHALQSSGSIDAMNKEFAKRAEAKVRRPTPVAGITRACGTRSWLFDPSIVIDHDIRDNLGNLIAARGKRINPLDFEIVKTPLVFIDGDDPLQVAWATKHFDDRAKLIMTSGAPLAAMKQFQRRFYFDQAGQLTGHFGIHAVPAVVVQEGHAMRVTEIAKLSPGGGA